MKFWIVQRPTGNATPPLPPSLQFFEKEVFGCMFTPYNLIQGREREREREIKVENPWEIFCPLQTKNFHSKFVGLSFSSIKTIYWSLICNTACSQIIIRITLKSIYSKVVKLLLLAWQLNLLIVELQIEMFEWNS